MYTKKYGDDIIEYSYKITKGARPELVYVINMHEHKLTTVIFRSINLKRDSSCVINLQT